MSTAYLWHGYGRSTIGARSDIEHVPIPRLQAFYHIYYQPDNATLVVAGKFDEAKTLAWIKETSARFPSPRVSSSPPTPRSPRRTANAKWSCAAPATFKPSMMAYHTPAGSHPDAAALEVLAAILGETPSGRLYKALVETKKAVSASGDNYDLHDPGVLELQRERPQRRFARRRRKNHARRHRRRSEGASFQRRGRARQSPPAQKYRARLQQLPRKSPSI